MSNPRPTPSRRNRTAKGARLERLAKEWLEAQGWQVQLCPNQVVWIVDKQTGERRPISMQRDFFGLWDGIYVGNLAVTETKRERCGFFQVTVREGVAERRRKILASPFPCRTEDMLLAYFPGRNRHFRVFRGPDFERWEGECLMPSKAKASIGEDMP